MGLIAQTSSLVAALMLIAIAAAPIQAAGYTLYVSPSGDDSHPGTRAKPLRSLSRARDVVRTLNATTTDDIVVYLRGGEYRIQQTVQFDAKDSGRDGQRIIYRAAPGETPILTGGVRITNWKPHDVERGIYRAAAPKTGFRQLYIDGRPAIRARTPDRDSDTTFGPYWKLSATDARRLLIDPEHWKACRDVERLGDVELVILSHWYHQRIRIGKHESSDDGVLVTPMRASGKLTKKVNFYNGSNYYFENALAFVNAPGEWYHDSREGVVYLALEDDPNHRQITVPQVDTLVAIVGTPEAPVRNLVFEGIAFECTNWTSPSSNGLNITQFAQPVGVRRQWDSSDYPPAILRAVHAQGLVLRNNTFRNAGANGVQFFADVDNAEIEGNTLQDIAANGIEIDTHAAKNPSPDQQSTDVAIWNNHITRCGQQYTNGGGVLAHNVRRLVVEHNHIHDMPYSGMQIGNQPGEMQDVGCGDNRVRYNHVHHCVQLHDDGGGIYTLGGIQAGTVIAENYLHDIRPSQWAGSYPISSIYLDNFSSRIHVTGNVIKSGKAEERNRSAGNVIENNPESDPQVEARAGIRDGYRPERAPSTSPPVE